MDQTIHINASDGTDFYQQIATFAYGSYVLHGSGWASENWSSSYVSPGTRLQDRSFSVRLSQYADLLFRRPAFAFHSSDSFG